MKIMLTITYIVLLLSPVYGQTTPQTPPDTPEAVLELASKASDGDAADLILSSFLTDESKIRSAFLTARVLDERTVYILFGERWGSRAGIPQKDRNQRHRILVESVSTKPELIRSVIRADRYAAFFLSRKPAGAATINYFPFFADAHYADDLIEWFIEYLRQKRSHPAKDIESPYNALRAKTSPSIILLTADEVEVNRLWEWQMLCGVCNRLDIINKSTTKNWRNLFPELDKWFQANRPFIIWDDSKSCIRIDDEAKKWGERTPRASRFIPEFMPTWTHGEDRNAPIMHRLEKK